MEIKQGQYWAPLRKNSYIKISAIIPNPSRRNIRICDSSTGEVAYVEISWVTSKYSYIGNTKEELKPYLLKESLDA